MSDCIFCKLFEKLDAYLRGKAEAKGCGCGCDSKESSCCGPKPEDKKEENDGCCGNKADEKK